MVKNPLAMQKTQIWSLGWEDPLEEGMATHSSVFAWRIPTDRGAWWALVHEVAKSQTQLSDWAQHITEEIIPISVCMESMLEKNKKFNSKEPPKFSMTCKYIILDRSLVGRMVKIWPAMQETWLLSLDWEDPLEKGMATHSSILAWRIPWMEEPGGL